MSPMTPEERLETAARAKEHLVQVAQSLRKAAQCLEDIGDTQRADQLYAMGRPIANLRNDIRDLLEEAGIIT